MSGAPRGGLWARAGEVAAQTPDRRHRGVDFLRAVSILVVIYGHWLAAAPYLGGDGTVQATHILAVAPWTHHLTWLIQVMPVFFLVGGFSNGTTWSVARERGTSYGVWLDARQRRLVGPVLPLIAAWAVIAAVARLLGVSAGRVAVASQMALIPTWFLAVYVMVVLLTPWTHALWRRYRWGSLAGLVAGAVLLDVAFFAGWRGVAWTNYLFVWCAVHQLGYAWSEGRLESRWWNLLLAAAGLALLLGLTRSGPYPTSLVGVPGDGVSNTTPPKVPLLALGAAQAGLLFAVQGPLRRWLQRPAPWTATVLVNGMIMSLYLWHLTAMMLVLMVASALGGPGLGLEPGSGSWWSTRPLWLLLLSVVLLPLVLLLAGFERPRPRPAGGEPPAWRSVLGAVLVGLGIALLALDGVAGEGPLGLRWPVLLLPFLGALAMRGGRGVRGA